MLHDTLGVWLYLTDHAYRHDGAGGISVEGTQYASNGLGPVALLMAALHTAGQDDPQKWGPQVSLHGHPFWKRAIPAYLAQLTPTPRIPGNDTGFQYLGEIFQPPPTGDLETFLQINNQYIKVLAPGGPSRFAERMINTRSNKALRDAIYTFLIFDPSAPPATDPRPALQPKTFFSAHTVNDREMGLVAARSGYTPDDTYFFTSLDWNRIDHQRADSPGFGLWKNGLWLTRPMTGYGLLQGCTDYRNSLSLQNGVPTSSPVQEYVAAAHGSQWCYSSIAHASAREDGASKAELFVTRLLPAGATMQTTDIASGEPSGGEDMKARLFTEAPGHPQEAHFLHVIQGADPGTPGALPAQPVGSSAGTPFEGAVVGTTSVLFRQDPDPIGDGFTFSVPATVTRHFLTGLTKSAGFDVNASTVAGTTTLTVTPGGSQHFSDSGGVLVLGGSESATVEIAALDTSGAKQGGNAVSFQLQRSGDLAASLTVDFQYLDAATAADFVGAPTSVTFAAGSPGATLTLVPFDDADYENMEEVVIRIVDGAGYHANEVLAEASAGIVDNDAPAGGYLQFASDTFTANEASASATVTIQRSGGTTGAVTAIVSAPGLQPARQPVNWAAGDATDKHAVFTLVNDAIYAGDLVVNLSLGTVTGAAAAGVPGTAQLTILDDEPAPPGQITFASPGTNVSEAAGALTIQVSRVNGKGGAVMGSGRWGIGPRCRAIRIFLSGAEPPVWTRRPAPLDF